MKFATLVVLVISCLTFHAYGLESSDKSTIYDPDPAHLWNRLNGTLFARTAPDGKTYGLNELDILYWHTTKNLLTGLSQAKAMAVLEEFISSHGENLIHDPLKRALLQRDLWELFDWSAEKYLPEDRRAARELQSRLATIMRRLALTTNEIATLPDNYIQSEKLHVLELPARITDTNGDWVNVGLPGYGGRSVAPTHVEALGGHSAFFVMLHVPGGRKAALDYLEQLRRFKQTERVWVYHTNRFQWAFSNAPNEVLELSTNIPQFPAKTEWALVRRMCVIAADGTIQPTRITESIQMRRYLRTDKGIGDQRFETNDAQQFFEFQMDKRHAAALRAIGPGEKDFLFVHFMGKGIDAFERNRSGESTPRDSATLQAAVLGNCFECHSSRGIFSVLSYIGFQSSSHTEQPADLVPVEITQEAKAPVYWKERRYDWGLLQGLWLQNQ